MLVIRTTFKNGFDPLVYKPHNKLTVEQMHELFERTVAHAHKEVVKVELKEGRKILRSQVLDNR